MTPLPWLQSSQNLYRRAEITARGYTDQVRDAVCIDGREAQPVRLQNHRADRYDQRWRRVRGM